MTWRWTGDKILVEQKMTMKCDVIWSYRPQQDKLDEVNQLVPVDALACAVGCVLRGVDYVFWHYHWKSKKKKKKRSIGRAIMEMLVIQFHWGILERS